MDNYKIESDVGIPYQDINWYDIEGQPFGIASRFNVIVFGDANNIVDTKGAMAVGGNFFSPRGLSLAFGNDANLEGTGYSPYAVRFLVGGDISMTRPLVVVGHVVTGGIFRAGSGSTYLIGKLNTLTQEQQLQELYQVNGGSIYWKPKDEGDHYLISNYDAPRYIPADRIGANLLDFFQYGRESIINYKKCIEELEVNGTVIDNIHEWILRGSDPKQNIFLIDVSPEGILNKGIRAEVPEGSLVIVRLKTGSNAHMQYGVWGEKNRVYNTLYVFEDAQHIYMEVPADIWGSILAPQAMFHAHSTGGHVSGNAALGSFAVNANSGFEFHLFPFAGGIKCQTPAPEIIPTPNNQPSPTCPVPVPCPEAMPCPEAVPCPEAAPCPACPVPVPCPEAAPCPACPVPVPCPEVAPCPACPVPTPCPVCPKCPEVPPVQPCPETQCEIIPGIIFGFIWGCDCCKCHKWEVTLYLIDDHEKMVLYCEKIESCGCFRFRVTYNGNYLLKICPYECCIRNRCKPHVTLKNIGVASFSIEY